MCNLTICKGLALQMKMLPSWVTHATYCHWQIQWTLYKTTTRFCGLSRQVVYHDRENKDDFVKNVTVPGKLHQLYSCVCVCVCRGVGVGGWGWGGGGWAGGSRPVHDGRPVTMSPEDFPFKRSIQCSKRELFRALLPLLRHMMPLNDKTDMNF